MGINTTATLACVGCSTDNGNELTVFRTDSSRRYCERPTSIAGLVNATQYLPLAAGSVGAQYLRWNERVHWAVNRSYRIQPVRYDAVWLTNGRNVTGTVHISVSSAPEGLFINTITGEMLYNPLLTQTALVSQVTVNLPEYMGVAVIANMSFEVLVEDVRNPNATGPGNDGCHNGGVKTDTYVAYSRLSSCQVCD